MAKHGSRSSKRFATLAALTLISGFFSALPTPAVAATVSGLTSHGVTDREFARKLVADPNAKLAATFLADATALRNQSFASLIPTLERGAGGFFTGRIALAEMQKIASVPGLRVNQNLATQVSPLKANVTRESGSVQVDPSSWPKSAVGSVTPAAGQYIWSGSNTVVNQEPQFDSVRAELGLNGAGQTVAVLDTGIDTNAVGLGGRVVKRIDFTGGLPGENCTDGGYLDPYGHGTHVSSIIGGAHDGNLDGSEGMAPGVKFVDLRVLNCAGSGYMSMVDEALVWLIENHEAYGVTVANLSLGTSGGSQNGQDSTSILINRLVAAGVAVVVAAGNAGDGAATLYSPATAKHAITVGAMSTSSVIGQSLAPFSSQGPTSDGRNGVDVIAPGVGIEAAASTAKGGGTVVYSGTSMASPYVAGLIALMRQQHPDWATSGEACAISEACPTGVVEASMVNDLLSNIKASDWFDAGPDPISGIGAVSASATLLGGSPASHARSQISITAGMDNELTIPAHGENATLTIMLESTWRPDIWANLYFTTTLVHEDGRVEATDNSCYNLSSWSCQIYSAMWSPRMINLRLAATDEAVTIRIRTTATRMASISALGIPGEILSTSLASPSSTLPLGSAIISEDDTLSPSGSAIHENLFIAENGDIYTSSKASFAMRAGAYAGLAKVPAGSTRATAIDGLIQSGQSQLDLLGLSASGSKMLMGEFPAGSGLVDGDDDLVYQLIVHDTNTDENVAVGPTRDATNAHPTEGRRVFPGYDVGNNIFNANFLSGTGNSVGYGYMQWNGSAETQIIGWQGGANYGTRQEWEFASNLNVHINSVSDSGLLFQTWDSANGLTHYFASATNRSVTRLQQSAGWGARFSADSSAYAYVSDLVTVRCFDGATSKTFTAPSGTNFFSLNGWRQAGRAVADDCSSVTAQVNWPALDTYAQVRIQENGTVNYLARFTAQRMSWRVDPSGTHYVTTTQAQIEATDSNGIEDTHRGIKSCAWVSGTVDTSGSPAVGNTLTASWTSSIAGVSIRYEWLRNGLAIAGAHSSSYLLADADAGTLISIRATLSRAGDCESVVTSTSSTWVPAKTYATAAAPIISGTFATGQTLTASVPTWSPSSRRLHYQWYQSGVLIKGATLASLYLTSQLAAGDITVRVTNRLPGYEAKSALSSVFGSSLAQLTRTPTPTIFGQTKVGQVLSASTGSWDSGVAISYQWSAAGEPISGATARTLKLTNDHAGKVVTLTVTGSKNRYQSVARTSTPTAMVTGGTFTVSAAPLIMGSIGVGGTLIAQTGSWGASDITFTYKWLRGKTTVSGATAATYSVTSADLGQVITLMVTANKAGFASMSKSVSTAKIGYLFTLMPTPTISGLAQVGKTLTASAGAWESGVKLTYQWYRNGSAISRATSSSYKLTSSDRGKTISVSVTGAKVNFTTTTIFSAGFGPIG